MLELRLPRSGEATRPDGSVERWDASVARWRVVAGAPQVSPQSPAGRAMPAPRGASGMPAGVVPFRSAARMYAGARNNGTTLGFGAGGATSADMELSTSLASLRARSRQMVRDSAYAKRAQTIVVNNVIGSGVGVQAQVGNTRGSSLNGRANDSIEAAWLDWAAADSCHTGGALHFHDLERMAMGQVFEAGEVLVRMHFTRVGGSKVPLSLEVIEAERLATELVDPGALLGTDNDVRMGVEVDRHHRAVAYWIRREHPGDLRSRGGAHDRYERVPAADVFHLRVVKRWPQTRGEPWLHAVLRKLDAMNEYSQYEVDAARASAAYFGTITSDGDSPPGAQADAADGQPVMNIESLTIQQLGAGEKFEFHAPNRPNNALDPFMRYMLREIAAGTGPSYESLSRDYSQSNYSSSRLALLDDRDLWRQMQQWWIRSFRLPLHRIWLQQAVLGGAVQGVAASAYADDPSRFEGVLFKPRGWSWVDPTKEVNAYKEAIKAGLTTVTDVVSATGGGMDIEDLIATRKRELAMFAAAGIDVDTTVPEPVDPAAAAMPADGAMAPGRPARVLSLNRNQA